jgi:hypothetical protein
MKSWTQVSAALAAVAAIGLPAAPASAQPAAAPVIDATTTLFCKDDTGEIKLVQYVSLGTVMRKFATRFDFKLSVQANPMVLTFSNPGDSPYFISYQAEPYRDDNGHSGIALLSAHLVLENTEETLNGTGMCFFTAFGGGH